MKHVEKYLKTVQQAGNYILNIPPKIWNGIFKELTTLINRNIRQKLAREVFIDIPYVSKQLRSRLEAEIKRQGHLILPEEMGMFIEEETIKLLMEQDRGLLAKIEDK